jgi:hypothetical protein
VCLKNRATQQKPAAAGNPARLQCHLMLQLAAATCSLKLLQHTAQLFYAVLQDWKALRLRHCDCIDHPSNAYPRVTRAKLRQY